MHIAVVVIEINAVTNGAVMNKIDQQEKHIFFLQQQRNVEQIFFLTGSKMALAEVEAEMEEKVFRPQSFH